MQDATITLPGTAPGARHDLTVLRFGRAGARPKVYVQGGLHADEGPGMIVARAIADRLAALDAAGQVRGEVVVVPAANPIGLGQVVLGSHLGRFDLRDGQNFNRGYPDLAPSAAASLAGQLGQNAAANIAAIRAALAGALAALSPVSPAERLKHALLGLALDADWVLDLHCDAEAVMHLYTRPDLAADFLPLAARLGARAVLLAEVSGHNPFDEAASRPWADLAAAFPGRPVPMACRACTVELRGAADVEPSLAEADAAAILDHLAAAGALAIEPSPVPAPLCAPTPLAGSEPLTAPAPGLIVYRAALGARVAAGEVVADVLDPVTGARFPVTATTTGVFYARAGARVTEAGRRIGKIAGAEARRTGPLLSP